MSPVKSVDRELIPDCCMSCSEILIDEYTLVCNCSGCDVLPFQCCSDYKRLKWYNIKEEDELQLAV
jgi:hypothetical protein